MADARQRTTLGNVFRFSIRGLGLSGLLAAAVGGVLLASEMPTLGPVGSVGSDIRVKRNFTMWRVLSPTLGVPPWSRS